MAGQIINNETLQVAELVLNKLGITLNEGINAFAKLAWTEWLDCLFVMLLILIFSFIWKLLDQAISDNDTKNTLFTVFLAILFLSLVFFWIELTEAVRAIVSPKAYAIKQILECIK